ncbi:MAG: L,D-transpeptidase family protein, partial [Hyphomonadaceae bacterium]
QTFPLAAPAAAPAPEKAPDEVAPGQPVSDLVTDLAGWVIATEDNRGLPFAVVDKAAAQILVFDAKGKVKGMAPILIGSAVGDASAPGVGDRELSDIPKSDRTTPAGRFLAGYGPASGGERALWVDYATAVSIHPMPTTAVSKKEKRKERLASPKPDDNRITHGCINVSSSFYKKVVSAVFKKGGIFYVLPDTMTPEEAFPGFVSPTRIAAATDTGAQSR